MEALYHVGFISLGQEIFETAYRYLDVLSRIKKKNFEILFGTGIAALQTQRTSEAVSFFKEALAIQPSSDIANIAMAFTLYKKKDYKSSINYAKHIIDNSSDDNAVFIAKRLLAFLYIEAKKTAAAVELFEELKEFCIQSEYEDELKVLLYDLGFANLLNDKKDDAYLIWNQLYQLERNFRNILDLVTRLRKEMDVKPGAKFDDIKPVIAEADSWRENAFPENYLWNICGLKSEKILDINSIINSGRISGTREKKNIDDSEINREAASNIDEMYKLDAEKFQEYSLSFV